MKRDKKHIEKSTLDTDYFKQLESSILAKVENGSAHLPLGVDHPFEADSDYFKKLEKSVLAKTEKSAFHLPLGIEHPFKSPVGYFQNLENEVLTKTVDENSSQSVFNKVWRNSRTYLRAAAAVLVVGFAGYFIVNSESSNTEETLAFSDFETETLVSYLENQELDIVDFASVMDDKFENNDFPGNEPLNNISEEGLIQLIDIQYANDI